MCLHLKMLNNDCALDTGIIGIIYIIYIRLFFEFKFKHMYRIECRIVL